MFRLQAPVLLGLVDSGCICLLVESRSSRSQTGITATVGRPVDGMVWHSLKCTTTSDTPVVHI